MAVQFRTYREDSDDFQNISDFLITLYQPMNRDGNWFQAIWEYSYTHPWTDVSSFSKIGIWEDKGEIVATIIYDMYRTDMSFCVHPRYKHLQEEMLEKVLNVKRRDGTIEQHTVEDILIHVVEEEIHHRGELLCIYWQLNIRPPYTSYMAYKRQISS